MKNIKKMMTAATLMMVLMVGTSFGGVLIQGISNQEPQPCTAEISKSGIILSDATGILIQGITGILIQGFTGVLIQGSKDESPTQCGVLIQG
jgi:uncharacterized protein YybS (DUF2232 family)